MADRMACIPTCNEPLSFSGADLIGNFSVEKFVNDCRKRVTLEELRTDLEIYFKFLKTALIEMINDDYSDFVTLSSKLVGLDGGILNLSTPLGQLKEELSTMQFAIQSMMFEVNKKLTERKTLQLEKVHLELLVDVIDCVESLEVLMSIDNDGCSGADPPELSMFRVAVEFNHLHYLVSETEEDQLVQDMLPRIQHITHVFYSSMELAFCNGMRQSNRGQLYECLLTYSTVNKQQVAEDVFRTVFVRPHMEKLGGNGLKVMLDKVLEFVHSSCILLMEVTDGIIHGDERLNRTKPLDGYNFAVNSVWPEVVTLLDKRAAAIFAPGNPDTFYKNFLVADNFLASFEECCGTQSDVKQLRSHPSYSYYMSKWTLPVYFQIRFQKIAGEVEHSLISPLERSNDGEWNLCVFSAVWKGLEQCWKEGIYLPPLVHRFWKLTLQILARLCSHLKSTLTGKISSLEWSVAVEYAALAVGDLTKTIAKLPVLFTESIECKLTFLKDVKTAISDHLVESICGLEEVKGHISNHIVGVVSQECARSLDHVPTIPRLYRRTNKDVPSKPSAYTDSVLKPLSLLYGICQHTLSTDEYQTCASQVVEAVIKRYLVVARDLLTSVKKTEDSLLKLQLGRRSAVNTSSGMSDDNKIRLQLSLDIAAFSQQVVSLGVSFGNPLLMELDSLGKSIKTVPDQSSS